ncbi:hypothetical protein RchiOBHm_Chr2g0150751 [Rosa chinensis]|uniref:Uncharacterized protein n=1 Tax=Rosa chinensis TaxID=74649 RepID=A0A2P6RZY2_ROSCH|nr:hypothetical protein RchiOBHm_Chr2g0150751 [Rosa chinensis]
MVLNSKHRNSIFGFRFPAVSGRKSWCFWGAGKDGTPYLSPCSLFWQEEVLGMMNSGGRILFSDLG